MIDHIYLPVTDLKRSDTFCGGMLGPLGKSERWHFKAHARLQAFSRPMLSDGAISINPML